MHSQTGLTIKGSPFSVFRKLHNLRLYGSDYRTFPYIARGLTLTDKSFKGLDNIQELALGGVIVNPVNAWVNAIRTLYTLTHLNLNGVIVQDREIMCSLLSNLTYVDISRNNINEDFRCRSLPNLKVLNASNNNFALSSIVALGYFCDSSPHLYEVDLSGNPSYLFYGFFSLVKCPNLVNLRLSKSGIGKQGYSYPRNRIYWPRLQTLYLDQVWFTGQSSDYQKIPISSVKQVTMFLQSPGLTILDLSGNEIEDIDAHDAVMLSNLTHLSLANNRLTNVNNLQYLINIQTLILAGNNIIAVPQVLFSGRETPLHTLDLGNNPFTCDCALDAFRKWISRDKDVYLKVDEEPTIARPYQCLSPDSRQGLSITGFNLDCGYPLGKYLTIGLSCSILFLLTVISVIRYRWHIQYKLFLLFIKRKRYDHYIDDAYEDDDNDVNEYGIPRFDGYVAYHGQDEDWVAENLVKNIEEGDEPFKLCLPERDIPAGGLKIPAFSMCIQRSRKTLVILTPRFVEDNWCYFQLSMAHQRMLEEGRNTLIIILLEDIPNERMTLILRELFCKVRCFKWPLDDEY